MNEGLVRSCGDVCFQGFPRADGDIELWASLQRVFQPVNFGDVTDGVRDLVEDVVVEGVSADEVAEGREGRKFFLDVVFDVEHIVSVQGAEHDGDMPPCSSSHKSTRPRKS